MNDTDSPLHHFWLGDQVHLDVPWRTGFRAVDINDQVAKRYLDNWEIGTPTRDPEDEVDTPDPREPDQRLGYIPRSPSKWFLPDDHEFWNGYPKVRYRTLARHALKRRLRTGDMTAATHSIKATSAGPPATRTSSSKRPNGSSRRREG